MENLEKKICQWKDSREERDVGRAERSCPECSKPWTLSQTKKQRVEQTNKGEAGKLGKNEKPINKTWYLHVA